MTKTIDIILLSYSLIVFTTYLVWIYSKYGILKSVSDSYYHIKHKYVFTLVMWSVAIPMAIVGMDLNGDTPLMFFAGSGIAFVGAASAFKDDKITERSHIVGATAGIVLGFVSLWVDFHLWHVCLFMLAFTLFAVLFKIKNHTWWIEIEAFAIIIECLFETIFRLNG
jgi:hypothetical protein